MQTQVIARALGFCDREKDRVFVQIHTEIALPTLFLAVVRHSQRFDETALDVVPQLAAAVVPIRAEVTPLAFMIERLTVAFVVGKAVEAEFEFDRQRLVGHLKRQLERLQVRHAARASVDD